MSLFIPKKKKKAVKKQTPDTTQASDLPILLDSISLSPKQKQSSKKPAEKKKKLASVDIEEVRRIDLENEADLLIQKARNLDLKEKMVEYREEEDEDEYSEDEEDVYMQDERGQTVELRR
jgi:hypothetical protein